MGIVSGTRLAPQIIEHHSDLGLHTLSDGGELLAMSYGVMYVSKKILLIFQSLSIEFIVVTFVNTFLDKYTDDPVH